MSLRITLLASSKSQKLAFLFLFLFLLSSSFALAEAPAVSFVKCENEVKSTLQQWGSLNIWKRTLGEGGVIKNYSPTNKLGVWIVVDVNTAEQVVLQRIETSVVTVLKYNTARCRPELNLIESAPSQDKNARLTDTDISQFIDLNKNGAIYVWSPGMPFSVDGFTEILKATAAEKIKVMVVLDPAADIELAKKILEKKKLPLTYATKSNSTELKFRGVYDHFPYCFFFKNGKVRDRLIPGYKSALGYQAEYKALK